MLNHLIVILESGAASFCCYNSNIYQSSDLISLESLREIIGYAIKNNIFISFLYGESVLPHEYQEVIETVGHIKIISVENIQSQENAVLILDTGKNQHHISRIKDSGINNIILRIGTADLDSLNDTVGKLIGKFKRLNIILKDIDNWNESSFSSYQCQLEEIRLLVENEYRSGNFIEVNVLTDRIFLTNMNNCGAGCDHITLAPNDKFYLCPAFFYENSDNHIGSIDDAAKPGNNRLLELTYSPVCRNCDAYHCKRCIYLNQKFTAELNIPSSQQCIIAHIERDISRKFLANISKALPLEDRITPIPEIDYRDPFTILTSRSLDRESREGHFAELLSKPLENIPLKQLLLQIYTIDPGILTKLKDMNYICLNLDDLYEKAMDPKRDMK